MQEYQPHRLNIRVLVADSTPISSQLLSEAVARHSEIEVLGYGSDLAEISALAKHLNPDVLLISAQIEEDPELGLTMLQRFRIEQPTMKAVVLLNSRRPELIVRAFRSGASGVFYRSSLDMLCKCIAAVHQGQIWANSEELGYVLAALADSPPPRMLESRILSLLSRREREVVGYLVEGRTNREIAETLGISQHSVKNYLFKIFEKVGMSNRVELVSNLLTNSDGPGRAKGASTVEGMANKAASQFVKGSLRPGGRSAVPLPAVAATRALRTG